jgi:GNAT superfamily N-acetyltransferase
VTSVGDAGRLFARAFATDPVITHFLGGVRRRAVAFPAFFRAIIFANLSYGHVYGAWENGHLVGVAVWTPPSVSAPNAAGRPFASLNHAIVRFLFPHRSQGLYGGFGATASLHPGEPHWYLAFVGVEPNRQGQGVGAQLLAPVLQRADADGVVCYLETPFPASHAFYRRLGFDLGVEAWPFEGAPPIRTMTRRPRPIKNG